MVSIRKKNMAYQWGKKFYPKARVEVEFASATNTFSGVSGSLASLYKEFHSDNMLMMYPFSFPRLICLAEVFY
jgi:hypothetical protein